MTGANHRDVLVEMAERAEPAPAGTPQRDTVLVSEARGSAQALVWLPGTKESGYFAERWRALNRQLEPLLSEVDFPLGPDEQLPEDLQWMHDNVRLVRATQSEVQGSLASLKRVPHVRTADGTVTPRVLAIAQAYLQVVEYRYSDHSFTSYLESFQTITGLNMGELSLLVPALKLVVLEEFVIRGREVLKVPEKPRNISDLMGSMREMSEAPWKELLEPLIVFEPVLAQDPARAYARMDFETAKTFKPWLVFPKDGNKL